jgi:hypothetical protein
LFWRSPCVELKEKVSRPFFLDHSSLRLSEDEIWTKARAGNAAVAHLISLLLQTRTAGTPPTIQLSGWLYKHHPKIMEVVYKHRIALENAKELRNEAAHGSIDRQQLRILFDAVRLTIDSINVS